MANTVHLACTSAVVTNNDFVEVLRKQVRIVMRTATFAPKMQLEATLNWDSTVD
jgi:hypothetical protein